MAALRVFGTILGARPGRKERQTNRIVAARSRAAAARLFNVSKSYAVDYVSETRNQREIEVAMSNPGMVFAKGLDDRNPRAWEPLEVVD